MLFILFISTFTIFYFDSIFIKTGILLIISFFYYRKILEGNEENLNKENNKCDYLAKANLIIDSDANKVFDILTDLKNRREWDNFIRQPEDFIENSRNCGLEV